MESVLVFDLDIVVIIDGSDIDENATVDVCVFGLLKHWHGGNDISKFMQWHRVQRCNLRQLATFSDAV